MHLCHCSNIYYFPESFDTCSGTEVDFGMVAATAGEYTLRTSFLGTDIYIKATFEEDQAIKFPTKGLNEQNEFLAQIFNPEGAEVTLTKDSKTYNCFLFATNFKIAL